jgi:hypothetical protein
MSTQRKILIADPPWEGEIQRPKRNKAAYQKLSDYPRLPLSTIQKQLYEYEKEMDASLVWSIDRYIADELLRPSTFDTRRTLIWWKAHSGIGWNVRYAHEYVIARWDKGFRTLFNLSSVLIGTRTDHRFLTSKPIELLVTLVDSFAGKNGIVYEMYKGSDNLKNACDIVGCRYEEVSLIQEGI